MMSYNYPEGTISYISVLIEKKNKKKKKTSMTRVPMGKSQYYLAIILDSKKENQIIEEGVVVCRQ